ncbi:hypothetical protein BOTBODRAFT_145516 [Botryobasidium botryosum FD-172 SS1]|uniref:Uncharacterized protein n=1 Tax=Botryobasidium botryosum (strain FD-172 SS1) TaxID=930990 RepID=A0A067MS35_BOTB1|nr:hypothetical protein BOTBODRAFT_145516 [Botryobasidium botryosum FD-172 SS1]
MAHSTALRAQATLKSIFRARSSRLLSPHQQRELAQAVLPAFCVRGRVRHGAGLHTTRVALYSPQPPPPPSPSEYERESVPTPSRHLIWYRDFVPAMIPLVLLGSCIYIGLQLGQSYLAHEKYLDVAHARITELEGQLDDLRRDAASASHTNHNLSNEPSKGRWWSFGLF